MSLQYSITERITPGRTPDWVMAEDFREAIMAERQQDRPLAFYWLSDGRAALVQEGLMQDDSVMFAAETLPELNRILGAYYEGFCEGRKEPTIGDWSSLEEAAAAVPCHRSTLLRAIRDKPPRLVAKLFRGYLIGRADLKAFKRNRYKNDGRRRRWKR